MRWHSKLDGSHGDLAGAMGVARSTAQSRVQALLEREPSEGERPAPGERPGHLVTIDLDDEHTHFVPTDALREFAASQRSEADDLAARASESGSADDHAHAEHRRAWVATAEALLDHIDDAR
ncbi:hypothetical protein [Nonomuraea sp. NPDC049141]|uniref:hypothetical protein n=1 Tax=Nonomuraea sp. NPDC049141 TaxID=3155500 RepID=UPI0033E30BD4